jgi:hypothetical protein
MYHKRTAISLAFLLLLSLRGNAATNEDKVPFLHFPFDEIEGNSVSNSGSGGQKYNALIIGKTVSLATGVTGKSVKLGDGGYLKLPEGVTANITDFTLSVWVYIYEQKDNQTVCVFANGTNQYLILTTQRGNAENGVSLVMTNSTGHGNHTDREERISYTGQKEKLSANAWHHIAFTLKGSTGTLYVDGMKAEVKSDFTANLSTLGYTADNYIGKSTWPDPFLNGMIDDFRLYDCALTEKQIGKISAAADSIQAATDRKNLSLDGLSAITSDLVLPATCSCGSTVTWQSSRPDCLNSKGTVFRPDAGAGDADVILTATVRKGSAVLTKDFRATAKDLNTEPADLHVFSVRTGNPAVPAYLADASLCYDSITDTFYAYGTNDGAGGGNVYPPQMWYSKDCKVWKNREIVFPKSWTDYAGTVAVWAPSTVYNPATKKYYLMYSIKSRVFIGMSDHPLGPWEDANGAAPGKMFYRGYDGQFFIDEDNTVYIITDAWNFKLMKMKFDEAGKMYFDNDSPEFALSGSNDFVGRYNYTQFNEIKNAFEASFINKKNNLYYLMWSYSGGENYNVRYAVSENITGPWREINSSMTEPILVRDDRKHILGPGHHSMFDYNGRTFIAYHRQHYPFVDSKRQTCINEVFFESDGSIRKITPTHRGVAVAPDAPEDTRKNIALRRQTKVSSARDYDSSAWTRRYRTHDISFRYSGHFAVDENFGTRWDAGAGAKNPYLIVDLGSDCRVDRIETFFEFTSRTYRYRLEYLPRKEAKDIDIDAASEKNTWSCRTEYQQYGGKQAWQILSVQLNKKIKGIHKKLYLVFKGDTETENLFNLNWFRFG